jgi:hypothetical protein
MFKFIERAIAGPGTDFVLRKDNEAEYIVQHLDSHMGNTVGCLRAVLEGGKTVEGKCDWFSLLKFRRGR